MKPIKLADLKGRFAPLWIENLENPDRSTWAFYKGKTHGNSAWMIFILPDGGQVGYNIESYGKKWLAFDHYLDMVEVNKVAELMAKYFESPCNFTPIDEEMADECGDGCDMNDVSCWRKWITSRLEVSG